MAEKQCWAVKQAMGRLCCDRSACSVLETGFPLDPLVYVQLTLRALSIDFRQPFRNVDYCQNRGGGVSTDPVNCSCPLSLLIIESGYFSQRVRQQKTSSFTELINFKLEYPGSSRGLPQCIQILGPQVGSKWEQMPCRYFFV